MVVVTVPVISDDPDPVGAIRMHWGYLDRLAEEAGLDTWMPEAVRFYACTDGPVLVLWGSRAGVLAIRGITITAEVLRSNSRFLVAWERHKAIDLTIADVHNNILETLGRQQN